MKILVTGGTGYIGSHTCVELLQKGYEVVVFDNLYNSKIDVVDKIQKIAGKPIRFYKADMLDKDSMRPVFEENQFDAVIHFAGLKAVGESVEQPLRYYQNNITGTLNLLQEDDFQLIGHGVRLAKDGAHHGRFSAEYHQPLRQHQADVRGDFVGFLRARSGVERGAFALF